MLRLRTVIGRRFFTTAPMLRYAEPTTTTPNAAKEVPLSTDVEDIPGFRQPGELPTNYEIAMGVERYEHLSKLQGKDPWKDMGPIVLTHKGTKENPIRLSGYDPVFYVGCSGQ